MNPGLDLKLALKYMLNLYHQYLVHMLRDTEAPAFYEDY